MGKVINPKKLGLNLGLGGLLLAIAGGYFVWSTQDYIVGAHPYHAEVVRYESRTGDVTCPHNRDWQPVFAMVDEDGTRLEVVDPVSYDQRNYEVGSHVDILYNPAVGDLFPVRPTDPFLLWVWPGYCLALSVLLFLGGGLLNIYGPDRDIYVAWLEDADTNTW